MHSGELENYKILLVDDESQILGALKRTFFDEPWETYTANSGEEGMTMLYEHDFAVVLSDYKMPDMNGVEFLTKVKASAPETVRMIISGYAEAHAIVEAINEGQIFRFIPKPWNNTELVNIVRQGIEFYALFEKNRDLEASLRVKNAELAAVNEDLEERVRERTRELMAHNQALTFVQEVLDDLPYAIFGVDSSGMIVLVNKRGFALFDPATMLLGSEVDMVMPSEVAEMVVTSLEEERPLTLDRVKIEGDEWVAQTVPFKRNELLRGVSLILRGEGLHG